VKEFKTKLHQWPSKLPLLYTNSPSKKKVTIILLKKTPRPLNGQIKSKETLLNIFLIIKTLDD